MEKMANLTNLSEPVLMVIDSGKMNTKGVCKSLSGEEIAHVFRTNVVEIKKIAHADFKVNYNEKIYCVGDSNHAPDPDHLKTEKNIEMHIISTLRMIYDLIETANYPLESLKFDLGINMPIKQYLNPDLRPTFINQYKGEHEVVVNNRKYSFDITFVEHHTEGMGILYLNAANYKGKRLVLVDNGGLNTSFIQVDNLRPMAGSDSLETGVHKLAVEISKRLSHRGLKHEQIIDILEQNVKTHSDEEIDTVVAQCLSAHVKQIYTALDSVSRAILTDFVFTDGSSEIYHKDLERYFPHFEFSENALFDNAKGFYKKIDSKRRKDLKQPK
ncbi:ParM/StbA family protein [Turicibacter sanguinis]|uniref:ParM/StbA family protein n=1 Tax=Turicibacter sanguinis TaxID=154288 RepID=UPI002943B8D9|nr:ParM/StbA family protein [Turicibacter sanguinis]